MSASHTYSFADVQATLQGPGGVAILGGESGAAKEGITIEPSEDVGVMTVGAGGEVMHSLHVGRPGKAIVRLLKTSPLNAVLSAMFATQAGSAATFGKNTLVIGDIARGDIVTCLYTAFAKFAAINYGEDAGMNEWTFNVGRISFFLGTGA